MWIGAVEIARDLPPHGWVDVESIQLIPPHPPDIVGLGVGSWPSADRTAEERHFVLLADLPVGIGDDVRRVGERSPRAR